MHGTGHGMGHDRGAQHSAWGMAQGTAMMQEHEVRGTVHRAWHSARHRARPRCIARCMVTRCMARGTAQGTARMHGMGQRAAPGTVHIMAHSGTVHGTGHGTGHGHDAWHSARCIIVWYTARGVPWHVAQGAPCSGAARDLHTHESHQHVPTPRGVGACRHGATSLTGVPPAACRVQVGAVGDGAPRPVPVPTRSLVARRGQAPLSPAPICAPRHPRDTGTSPWVPRGLLSPCPHLLVLAYEDQVSVHQGEVGDIPHRGIGCWSQRDR